MAAVNARTLFAFSGMPSVVEYGEALVDEANRLGAHMAMVASHVEAELRRRAMADDRWKPLAGSIQVWAEGDTFVCGVKGPLADQAEELEFGGMGNPPHSILRSGLLELLPNASRRFDRKLDTVGRF